MQTTNDQAKLLEATSQENKNKKPEELLDDLKFQWKLLWAERFTDKVRAEDISINNYALLNVDQGTIIHATRDFKVLNFREILQQLKIENPDHYIQPDAQTGGWNKFVKTKIKTAEKNRGVLTNGRNKGGQTKQVKKGGRGWLHTT